MKVKMKIDIGLKTKKKKSMKKRILPMAKRGILSILPLLEVFGSLVSDAAVVAKAVNNNKAAQRQLEERHNHVMESQSWSLSRSVLAWTRRHNGKIKKIKKNVELLPKISKGVTAIGIGISTGPELATHQGKSE